MRVSLPAWLRTAAVAALVALLGVAGLRLAAERRIGALRREVAGLELAATKEALLVDEIHRFEARKEALLRTIELVNEMARNRHCFPPAVAAFFPARKDRRVRLETLDGGRERLRLTGVATSRAALDRWIADSTLLLDHGPAGEPDLRVEGSPPRFELVLSFPLAGCREERLEKPR